MLRRARTPLLLTGLAAALAVFGVWVTPRPGSVEQFSALSDPLDPIPKSEAIKGPFRSIESGLLWIEHGGSYYFAAGASDGVARLKIGIGEGAIEVASDRASPPEPRKLAEGVHPYRLTYERRETVSRAPRVGGLWSKEIALLRPVPASSIYPPSTAVWRFEAGRTAPRAGLLVATVALGAWIGCFLTPARRRQLWFGVLTVCLALVGSLVVAEIALRILGIGPIEYISAEQGETYRFNEPGAEMRYSGWMPYLRKEFETTLEYNSLGLRDKEHAPRKAPGVFRIAVLGDSFVEAREVELEETFHQQVERMLNEAGASTRYEVIAAGLAGTSTSQQAELYEGLVRRFDIDLVVLVFFAGNDVMEISPELSKEFSQWIREVHLDKLMRAKIDWLDRWRWLEWSRVNQVVADRTMRIHLDHLDRFHDDLEKSDLVPPSTGVFHESYDARWNQAWEMARESIGELARRLESDGTRLVLVSVDSAHMFGERMAELSTEHRFDPDRPIREVSRICEAERIECLDLSPIMRRLREEGVAYRWPEDGHWTPEGHRVVAEALFEHLESLLEREPRGRP